jgi:hypothetical protein
MSESEKWIDISKNEHWLLLSKLLKELDKIAIKEVLDAGSGKTSISILLQYFNNAHIDAIVFPGDYRKINSIKEHIISNRYNLIEKDICSSSIKKQYDLVLAHLLLGEAIKWGNTVEDLLSKLLSIGAKYYIIYDLKEDPSINYNELINYLTLKDYDIIYHDELIKENSVVYNDFTAKTYIGFLITKKGDNNERFYK